MSEIQRYSEEGGHSCDDVYMCADDCGEWVRYEEHKARIQELEKENKTLLGIINNARHAIADHKKEIAESVPKSELIDELEYWVSQYGCECRHFSCKKCKDTEEAKKLLSRCNQQ